MVEKGAAEPDDGEGLSPVGAVAPSAWRADTD
jgi:hypothetical protein